MALSESIPWISSPAIFGEAMRAGASAGLSLRKQEQEEAETADRLRMAYDQLSSQERRAGAEAKQKLDLTRQGMSLRQAQNEGLLRFHQDHLETAKARDEEIKRHHEALEGKGQGDKIHFGTNGEILSVSPDGVPKVLRQGNPKISYHGPHVTLPPDENAVVMSGPSDSPEIAARLKQFADDALKKSSESKIPPEPNILEKGWSGLKSIFTAPGSGPLQAPRGSIATLPVSPAHDEDFPSDGTRVKTKGTRVQPAQPTTQDEFDALDSGEYYINPKDGRLMVKK